MEQHEKLDCGDERTIAMLYQKLGGAALSKTLYIIPRRQVAEEVVQEVFVKLWTKKVQFESIRQAYSWVYRSCTNAAIDFLRKKANQVKQFDETYADGAVDTQLNPMDKASLNQLVKGLLKIFSEEEAALFVYQNVEGLKQAEIVEVMGVSRRTVARIQDRVKDKVAKYAGERDGE